MTEDKEIVVNPRRGLKQRHPDDERKLKKPAFEATSTESGVRKRLHAKTLEKQSSEKPESWVEFKKQKKELKIKRKEGKSGWSFITKAKQMGEKLRCKNFEGGDEERKKLINKLHCLLGGQAQYAKFVLAHDTSRIVQWLLKYSPATVKNQISQELIPATLDMMKSKYGIFCIKRLLKYGSPDTRSAIINKMYGKAVKLTSHSLSAPVFEYAYTTWATTSQKHHLLQEFFGDLYRNSKDDKIKSLRDAFAESPDLKSATLGATKANLLRVINKNLLDSTLVQTVLNQYLSEGSNEDRAELISQLIPHIVVISNSKEGSRAAMQCIWHGTNKDRKSALKTLKEHVVELAKHEHGHCTVITMLDTADDTVLLNKILLSELLKEARDLAVNEWGRKVLLWLVSPTDPKCFHPVFVRELEEGRSKSAVKKDPNVRRRELLDYSIDTLLGLIVDNPEFWLQNASLAYEMLAILKAGKGDGRIKALGGIVKEIVSPDWKIKIGEEEVLGIESAGLHMVLKKLAKHDQNLHEESLKFGVCLLGSLTDEVLENWLVLNRGCFLLIAVYEHSSEEVQTRLKTLLRSHEELLKAQNTAGSAILLKKLMS